ncbi:MAG: HAD hydrolase-like protein [Oscillospiraceae bacterium]|nr:HAD hydrolase-like protein [Oscillospiraceae bacterium]MCD8256236.1 HAD hydrolase-like protein [Oscillospiraceae bacterium]
MLPSAYTELFFDLDGTLTDSGPGIMNSARYALERLGVHDSGEDELRRFVGPPLYDSFRRFYGFDEATAHEGVRLYREYYAVQGIFENTLYPGIFALLDALRAAGKRLTIATSKPEHFALRVAEHFALTDYFTLVAGALSDETRCRKADVVRYALQARGLTDSAAVLMTGDRAYDVRGAAECGMRCIGVLYGYGTRAELEEAGAWRVAESVAALQALLLP